VQPESWVDVAVLRIGHWLKLCYLHEKIHIEQMHRYEAQSIVFITVGAYD
jgi:hypothetical protein